MNNKQDRIHPAIRARARELRQPQTPAERVLWAHLRNRQLGGYKFRRQHPIGRDIRRIRGKEIAMVFQEPMTSLSPVHRIGDQITERILEHLPVNQSEAKERAIDILARVGIPKPAKSALDVSVQAQTLNLLRDLQQEFHLTYLFIAHDLSVVEHISGRVAVMYVGLVVETARQEMLYSQPRHPYTEALLSAVPRPDPRERRIGKRILLRSEVADPANPPSGCYFHPRCSYALDICKAQRPELRDIGDGHSVACHLAEELNLQGVL